MTEKKTIRLTVNPGDVTGGLTAYLAERGIYVPADCGGRGKCGRCRVRFLSGAPAPTEEDRSVFNEDSLKAGWRLACRAVLSETVELLAETGAEEQIAAETAFRSCPDGEGTSGKPYPAASGGTAGTEMSRPVSVVSSGFNVPADGGVPVLAVDLGTTTIAATLLYAENGQIQKRTASCVNHQRAFGADVISRIAAAGEGQADTLREVVLSDLADLAGKLGIPAADFADPGKLKIVISGNTTMQHLLQGLSCATLGVAPYTPVDISLRTVGNMTYLPGISTYVGADIVRGAVACHMDTGDEVTLLVDLGTNGEMILGKKGHFLCASTAAGPAFEAGNISCGMAGVPGAVTSVEILGGRPVLKTIGGLPAAGLCGTGVLETVYELLKEELIDETGLLDEAYFETGYPLSKDVVFTAKDVREVQLAKSAVRAGAEVLLDEYGISYGDVAHVWLAGGFGQRLNAAKAVGIGLLPEELAAKIVPVGNSSLAGAVLFAENADVRERFAGIAADAEEVALASNRNFNDLFMEHMLFPEM